MTDGQKERGSGENQPGQPRDISRRYAEPDSLRLLDAPERSTAIGRVMNVLANPFKSAAAGYYHLKARVKGVDFSTEPSPFFENILSGQRGQAEPEAFSDRDPARSKEIFEKYVWGRDRLGSGVLSRVHGEGNESVQLSDKQFSREKPEPETPDEP